MGEERGQEVVRKTVTQEVAVTKTETADQYSRRKFIHRAVKAALGVSGATALLNLAGIDSALAAGNATPDDYERALRKEFKNPEDAKKGMKELGLESHTAGGQRDGTGCVCKCSCGCDCTCTCTCSCSEVCECPCACTCTCTCDCGCVCSCECPGSCQCDCPPETSVSQFDASASGNLHSHQTPAITPGMGDQKYTGMQAAMAPDRADPRDASILANVGGNVVARSQAALDNVADGVVTDTGAAGVINTKDATQLSTFLADARANWRKVPVLSSGGRVLLVLGLAGIGWYYLRRQAVESGSEPRA